MTWTPGGKKNRTIWRPQPKVHPPHANLLIGGTIQSTVHIERAGVPRCAFNAVSDEKVIWAPDLWSGGSSQGKALTSRGNKKIPETSEKIKKKDIFRYILYIDQSRKHQKSCRPCVRAYTQSQSIFEKMTLNGIGLAFRVLAEKFQLARCSSTQ